ncbi:MAG TPA: PQQ-dependent sugar dehydrogenase, partial [Egibacteraceae bacterium]|nr:PQQ-dependent sugar dehydrogenase [Egibacteraceae bacterium]
MTESPAAVRRCVLAIAVVLLVLLLALLPSTSGRAQQPGQPTVERLAGPDRYATAAAVSRATFAPGVQTAYVASGEDFPDALASGPVAGVLGAPVLLVRRDDVPEATGSELGRLQPGRIVVLGGTAAVSPTVEVQLALYARGNVERLAGPDRFATAAAVSASHFDPGVAAAYVASGLGFPDALAGGAAGAAVDGPVLLVLPDAVPDPTARELLRLQPALIVVLGGEQAVSAQVAGELAAFTAGDVRRLAGAERYATAAAVSAATFPAPRPTVFLASGAAFPDALAGTPAAAAAQSPVLLVRPDCVPPPAAGELERLAPERVVILGGPAAVSQTVERLAACAGPREVSVVASGLQAPWEIVFAPGGRAYVTERDTGRLLAREVDGTIREVQRFAIDNDGEGGLLGLAASPAFSQDGLLYAFMTTAEDNRVVRFRPGEPPQPVLTGLPAASFHDGGRIAFGPDGLLYITTGDAGVSSRAQDPGSLGGKILRMSADGGVPADNPFPGSPVYALGLRNPQGLAWDAAGRLYATEFGPGRDDEVNVVVPGGNYGWPEVTGAAGDPRFVDPIVVRQPAEASWSGAAILSDGAIPEWEGSLFAA